MAAGKDMPVHLCQTFSSTTCPSTAYCAQRKLTMTLITTHTLVFYFHFTLQSISITEHCLRVISIYKELLQIPRIEHIEYMTNKLLSAKDRTVVQDNIKVKADFTDIIRGQGYYLKRKLYNKKCIKDSG